RTGQLSFLVRYAFSAKRSSAMGTSSRRFTQWMKQAARIAQARCRLFVETGNWFFRTHSYVWCPLWKRSRNLRRLTERRTPPVGELSAECLVGLWRHGRRAPQRRSWQGSCARAVSAVPKTDQRLHHWCECAILLSARAPVLTPPTRDLYCRKLRPS